MKDIFNKFNSNFGFKKSPSVFKIILIVAGSAFFYWLSAKLGFELASLNKFTSPVWPASGVAASLVFIFGWPAAVGIFFGASFSNFNIGLQIVPSLIIGLGNTSEAVIGVLVFHFLMRFKKDYGLHAPAIFVAFTIAISTLISSTIGTATLHLYHHIGDEAVFRTWATWWIGDAIGALLIVPLVHKLYIARWTQSNFHFDTVLKITCLVLLTPLLNCLVFTTLTGSAYLFIIFLPLLLAAVWFDTAVIYIISLLTSLFALFATISGHGPFVNQYDSSLHLQLFLMGLGITALGLGSLSFERLHRRVTIALLFGWTLSGITFFSFYNSSLEIDRNRFILKSEQAEEALQQKLKSYSSILESGVSFFNASDFVSKSEWATFTQKLLTNDDNSSFENLNVAFPTTVLSAKYFYKINHLKEKIPGLRFIPIQNRDAQQSVENPETHFIITYIEPYATKKGLVGIDLSSEKNRYEAALRARDSGLVAASGMVQLVSDRSPRPAFIMFAPIYKKNAAVKNAQQRRESFIGLVSAPIVFDHFINAAINKFSNELHLTATFESESGQAIPVFQSEKKPVNSSEKIFRKIMLAGQPVGLTWQKTSTFEKIPSLIFSLISFLGAVVSMLLAMMLSSLQNLNSRAQALATTQTKEILEKNRIWKLLTEVSPVAIFITDKNGHCNYVNPMWGKLTGNPLSDALGDGWTRSIHPEDYKSVIKNWNSFLAGGLFDCHYRFLCPDNSVVNVWAKAVPLPDEAQNTTGYLGTIQDMTDSVKKTNALIASSRMTSLGEMASGIAHEINNPLSIILGNADLLDILIDSGNFNPLKAKNYINQIHLTVQRITKIIRGLRSFSRDTAHEPFEQCSLKVVLNDSLDMCRERFKGHGILLIVPKNIDDGISFMGRSEQIAQVLLNLLNNAFDVASESEENGDKWVQVSIKTMLGKIQILVTDSGNGIESSKIEKIFEPFYTSKKIGKGTGLGLSISKGIMELHQGKLYVDRSSKNTTFVVELTQLADVTRKDIDFS